MSFVSVVVVGIPASAARSVAQGSCAQRRRAGGAQPGNEVKPSELGALEREPLHDALAIVKRFRGFLRQHFRLDSL